MSEAESMAEMNRKFWSQTTSYDTEDWIKEALVRWTAELQARADWITPDWAAGAAVKPDSKLLDFACGPGLVSHALAKHVSQVRGIDIADGMVERYNQRAREAGFSAAQMSAVRGDIMAREAVGELAIAGAELFDFDVAVIANALHHIEHPQLVIERLVQRLKPGGVLVVLDFVAPDGFVDTAKVIGADDQAHNSAHGTQVHGEKDQHGHRHRHDASGASHHAHTHTANVHDSQATPGFPAHPANHTIAHLGFDEAGMGRMLHTAGLVEIDFVVLEEPFKFGGRMQGIERMAFLIRGQKAE